MGQTNGLLTGLDVAGAPGSKGGDESSMSSWWLMTAERVWGVCQCPTAT